MFPDEEDTLIFATKKDVKALNTKPNLILQKSEASASRKSSESIAEFKTSMEKIKEEIQGLNAKILDHVWDESNNIDSKLHQVRMSQAEETKLHLMIANLEAKNAKLKEDLQLLDFRWLDKNHEIEHLKAQNFELNQRILKITEAKENPLLENLDKMLDTKLDTLCGTLSSAI